MYDIQHLEAFFVADERSFTKAAARMGYSPVGRQQNHHRFGENAAPSCSKGRARAFK